MKALHLFLAAGTAIAMTACGGAETEKLEEDFEVQMATLKVDTENSTLAWTGRKSAEDFHTGTVKFSDGNAEFIDGNLVSAKVSVDMTTLASTDEGLPEEKQTMLLGHLSSPDFFDVANNSNVKVICGAMVDGKLPVTIVISGTEIKQNIDAKVTYEDGKGSISGKFDIDFSALNAKGFQPKEGQTEHVLPVISFDLNLLLK